MLVRPLSPDDIPAAMRLTDAAAWNQTEADWRRNLKHSACFGIDLDGRLASSIAVTAYGTSLAWIGMVLTLPEFRGRGCASALMRAAMDHALGAGIDCIKLDATEAGAPVYRKFGFEDECVVERWRGTGSAETSVRGGGEPDWDLDREAFGADRRGLLESFPESFLEPFGHAMHRPGRTAAHFGPCVASDMETARSLALRAVQGDTFWDLFAGHPRAIELAHSLRFTPARKLLRMSYKGRQLASQNPELVYALAGFEWG